MASLALLFLPLLFLPLTAQAGTWQPRANDPVYSCTASPAGSISIQPGTAPPAHPSTATGGSSFTVTGTASFQWTWIGASPQDLPPAQVIVTEAFSSSVQAFGNPNTTYTLTPTPPTKYEVKSTTGGTFSLSLPVGATVSFSVNGGQTPGGGGQLAVTATAGLSWPTITPGGTYNPAQGDNRVLTGQQITATVQGLDGYVVTKYSWSGQSGTCFKTYNPNIQPPANNQLTPLGSTDTSGPAVGSKTAAPLVFYDRAAETLTLTCTVTVLAPDGTPLNLTVTSPPINVLKPTATWGITSGYVRSSMGNLGLLNVPGDTVHLNGQSWHDVVITVPSPFSGGTFCFAQTITPSVTIHRILPQGSTATDNYQIPNNGALGLDSVFPYDTDGVANGYSFPKPANTEIDGDSPSYGFPSFTGVTDNGGTNWDKSTTSESFTTYLMYKPSSSGAVWVPLKSYTWSWSAVWADIVNKYGESTWTPEPGNPTAGSTPTATDANTPPTWAVVHAKSDFSNYVPGPP